MTSVSLADAKARLSALIEQVERGETVQITKRGKPVAQISQVEQPRKPIDIEMLRAATNGMTPQAISAGEFIRQMRDEGY